MISIVMSKEKEELRIAKIIADEKTKRHLENLGLLVNQKIEIISKNNGNAIIKVKDSRIAIGEELARKIYVY